MDWIAIESDFSYSRPGSSNVCVYYICMFFFLFWEMGVYFVVVHIRMNLRHYRLRDSEIISTH